MKKAIFLTPTDTRLKPHIWVEAGVLPDEDAKYYHRQLVKMKGFNKRIKLYQKVEIIDATPEFEKQIQEWLDHRIEVLDSKNKVL